MFLYSQIWYGEQADVTPFTHEEAERYIAYLWRCIRCNSYTEARRDSRPCCQNCDASFILDENITAKVEQNLSRLICAREIPCII